METLGPFKGIYRVILRLYWGYGDNGKENGNYYRDYSNYYRDYIGDYIGDY